MTESPSNKLLHRLLRTQGPMSKSGDIQIRKLKKPFLRPAKKLKNKANHTVQLSPLKWLPKNRGPLPKVYRRSESFAEIGDLIDPTASLEGTMFATFSN